MQEGAVVLQDTNDDGSAGVQNATYYRGSLHHGRNLCRAETVHVQPPEEFHDNGKDCEPRSVLWLVENLLCAFQTASCSNKEVLFGRRCNARLIAGVKIASIFCGRMLPFCAAIFGAMRAAHKP